MWTLWSWFRVRKTNFWEECPEVIRAVGNTELLRATRGSRPIGASPKTSSRRISEDFSSADESAANSAMKHSNSLSKPHYDVINNRLPKSDIEPLQL